MKIIGIIPARMASSRLEEKVLADINGKPMIQHVWERAKQSRELQDVLIACDDDAIFQAAVKFGAKVVMTSRDHESGTDRLAEVVLKVGGEIIINIQGDEPLIEPKVIDQLAKSLSDHPSIPMATVIKPIKNQEDLTNPNVVKVVVDNNGFALYFSRSAIPFSRDGLAFEQQKYYKHLGIYAYRKDFLLLFSKLPKSCLEQMEKLEQLRVLENGYQIKTVVTDVETIGVDTPEDLQKVRGILKG
jgi:3-deoxy-manno-octulosonate cytidylyltransferase (CMP-KDO synthetase)